MTHRLLLTAVLSTAITVLSFSQVPGSRLPERISVAEFRALPPSDTCSYTLRGIVSQYRNQYHGNLYLKDGDSEVLIYGILDHDGAPDNVIQLDIQVGDSLVVYGRKTLYQGLTVEMKDARFVSRTCGPEHTTELATDLRTLDRIPDLKNGKNFTQWVGSKLKYPAAASVDGAFGIVTVRFIINEDGSVSDVHTIHGRHPALDAEAERVIRKSPKWNPGTINGKAVPVCMDFAVKFIIPN